MRNCVQKPEDESVLRNRRGGGSNGFFSVRSLSNYVRIVSSGASNVASSVRKAGASIVSSMADSYDDSGRDQVIWAGFDKLEREGNGVRQVLLLGYRSGFQVWDVEKADDVRQLVSRHDASASFLQMQKMPMASKGIVDKFADVRPLLIVVGDGITANCNNSDGFGSPTNSFSSGCHQELGSDSFLPTHVRFYSLMSHEYVHVVKFRSAVFSVRSSPRIIAVCQASQIHCFNPATLDRIYTILTHPVVSESPYPGSIGYGPLAVGARWLAYSGNLIGVSRNCVANPRDISPVIVAPSNGSLMAHFARESSKKLASGMVALGDMGYTTLAKYYSELTSETNATVHGSSNVKGNGTMHTEPADLEHDGMVIVRDIASRSVIVQFVAHKSPISALTFDPSGTLLVTASIHGHNINVFHIIPSSCARTEGSEAKGTSIHLYKLQRGITNAVDSSLFQLLLMQFHTHFGFHSSFPTLYQVIQDISFSDDGKWIIISSSRGTSHLFAIGYSREAYTKFNKSDLTNLYYGNPITLSAVSRIKNGNPMLKSAVSGVAAAATGKLNPFYGTVASVFHNCNTTRLHEDISSLKAAYYILVYSPTGSIIQYVFHPKSRDDSGNDLSVSGSVTYGLTCESDARLVIEALQKWDVCHKRNRRDRCDNFDMYNDHGCGENFPQKGIKKGTSVYPSTNQTDPKRKLAAKESHHMYISEIELHTHEAVGPLWLKSEVFFEVLMDHCSKEDHGRNSGGENDIERIPCRTVKARSKDLVPIFDSLQSSKLPETRTVDSDFTKNGSLFHHKSKVSEVGKHSCRSSCNTSDYSSENTKIAELTAGNNENGRGHHTQETEGIVNNHADTTDKECKPEFATHRGPS